MKQYTVRVDSDIAVVRGSLQAVAYVNHRVPLTPLEAFDTILALEKGGDVVIKKGGHDVEISAPKQEQTQ